jgi:hypothetical protein
VPKAPGLANSRLGLWWVVAAGLVVGLVVIVSNHVLRGGAIMTFTLAGAGVLRLVLPARRVGALAVRSRTYDVIVFFSLAAALAVILSALDLKHR